MGHSAGGTFINALLVSPLSQGLFHRAWILSGSAKIQTTWEQANQQNRFVLEKTACTSASCLRNLDAKQLVESLYPEWDYDYETRLPTKGFHTASLIVLDGI